MGLISCANFVIAGVDGVIHQRDFTSAKINANITLIIVPVDVTYNNNQSWFVANIWENQYNLLFYWHFSRWEIICIHGSRNSLKEYNFLGEVVEIVLVHVGMPERKITRAWKNTFTLIWKILILFCERRLPRTLIEKPEIFNSIKEQHFIASKGKKIT